eukprot:TRINITY_DN5875_c0_g1_i1.p1 TRINITY_DN5875_c0_g1~~TRINITY_DN5875_c0_g1_i1.p1  ORF type:complete len:235 (-),score=30.60 TRINITY_DN5875_c0_g1_i1:97-801(-)
MKLTVKFYFNDVTRRITLQTDPDLTELRRLVTKLFNAELRGDFSLTYLDDEGDKISMCDPLELKEALSLADAATVRLLKLYIVEKFPVEIPGNLICSANEEEIEKADKSEIKISKDNYVPFDKLESLGIYGYPRKEEAFSLPSFIPRGAKKVRIVAFLRCGSETGGEFHTCISSIRPDGSRWREWVVGYRYGQNAISFVSPTFEFDLWDGCDRKVYVYSDSTTANCHSCKLFVS